jgi:hypothetical protein
MVMILIEEKCMHWLRLKWLSALPRPKIADLGLPIAVEKQKVMLGTFSPRQEPYTYEAEKDTTPSGIFARGSYSAKLKVRKRPKENIIFTLPFLVRNLRNV